MYLVYDTKESEQCVGIFDTVAELAIFFNTSKDIIKSDISRNVMKKWRYKIVKIDDSVLDCDDEDDEDG